MQLAFTCSCSCISLYFFNYSDWSWGDWFKGKHLVTVVVHLHCQHGWLWNYLGDTFRCVYVSLQRGWTEEGTSTLVIGKLAHRVGGRQHNRRKGREHYPSLPPSWSFKMWRTPTTCSRCQEFSCAFSTVMDTTLSNCGSRQVRLSRSCFEK